MNTPKQKVLFVDTAHPKLIEDINELGFESVNIPEITREQLLEIIGEYVGIIIRSRILLDKEMLEKANNLRFIGRVGAGMENIDEEFARSKNIQCFNSPEGNRQAVAEHTLGMLLNLLHKLHTADQQVRKGIWNREENRGIELSGKTVGIIGYGNMGSAFARCLYGFDINVIAYDKYKTHYSDDYVCEKTLEAVFAQADIVSMHVPLTAETHYVVNDVFINAFQKNIFLLNTSRGKVVNTEDVVKNLKRGKLLGVGLDVIEYESQSFEQLGVDKFPEPFQYLIHADNVILTPHIAGLTVEANLKHAKVLAGKILGAFS